MAIRILYQDEHLVAVDKPPGLLVHRSPLSRERASALQRLRDQLGRRVYPVHRLDRATAGVLLFALTPPAAGLMAARFQARAVAKTYLAVARGWVAAAAAIDHPLADDDGAGVARPAVTRYRCLARVELPYRVDRYPSSRYSLVEVSPETGRRHQIRKHFKHISHHLVGDTTHGNGRHNRFFRQRFGIARLLLWARSLAFEHPCDGRPLRIEAPPDADWRRVAQLFDWPLDMEPPTRRRPGPGGAADGD